MNILNIDIESTGLEQWSDELCINAAYLDSPTDVKSYTLHDLILEIVTNRVTVSMHNGYSFDLPWLIHQERTRLNTDWLYEYFTENDNTIIDTLLISRLCYPHFMRHSLAEWIQRLKSHYTYLEDKVEIDDWSKDNLEAITDRNVIDVKAQCALTQHFIDTLCLEEQAVIDYHSANKFILDLSLNGIPFDEQDAKKVYANRILKANRKIINVQKALGKTVIVEKKVTRKKEKVTIEEEVELNLGSNNHIHKALINLYGEGLPLGEPSKKTGKQSPIYNKKNAKIVQKKFPILQELSDYREAMMIAKFVEPVVSKKSYKSRYVDGRIYPSVNMIEARTLRASYTNPPLQQMPDDMKGLVKGDIIDMDFSALEMQVLGYELKETFGETKIWDMNQQGLCPKQATADCLGSLLDNIPEDKRLSVSKTVNYAVLFGQQPKNTLNVLKLDRSYESELVRALDNRFPALTLLTNYLKANMRDGCIINLFGQRTSSPDYCVVNSFTQSSGALYAVKMFPLVYKYLSEKINLLAFIHDEILLEEKEKVSDEFINIAIEKAYREFENKYQFPVISKLNWKRGNTWLEAH